GQPDKAAKLNRVPAVEIEKLIVSAMRKHLAGKAHKKVEAEDSRSLNDKELISTHIARVDVKLDHLAVQFFGKVQPDAEDDQAPSRKSGTHDAEKTNIIVLPEG